MIDLRDLSPTLLTEQELQALKDDMMNASSMCDGVFKARREGRLHGLDVASHLKDAAAGKLPIKLADPGITWSGVYTGIVPFLIGGWRIDFFNDCDSLDYCERASAPDGRAGEFQEWSDTGCEPDELLTEQVWTTLEELLRRAI